MRTRTVCFVAAALSVTPWLNAQVVYPSGFVWHRATDWTPRPPQDENTSNGNPDDDQAGRPAWVYEMVVPPGNHGPIGSPNPWYVTLPAQVFDRCTWDSTWYGTGLAGWVRGNNAVPIILAARHTAYQGFYFPIVTWQRWQNVSSCHVSIHISGSPRALWGRAYAENHDPVDVVLLVRRANGTSEVLMERICERPAGGNDITFVVDLPDVRLAPNDSVVTTMRYHLEGTDVANSASFYDDLTFTLTQNQAFVSQQPESVVTCPRTPAVFTTAIAVPGSHAYTWRRNGVDLTNGETGTGSIISGADSAELTIEFAGADDEGEYTALVTTACGTTTSGSATLTVLRCCPDVNCDGSPDQGDVACMILAVAGDSSCICQDPDFNLDGSADQGDVAALIGVVAGQPCP